MKIFGLIINDKNKTIFLFSRHRHHFSKYLDYFVDGGQPRYNNNGYYFRTSHPDSESCHTGWVDFLNTNAADLLNDKNLACVELGGLLQECQPPDLDSWEWFKETAVWGTYGKGGNQPLKYKLVKNLDTDHIEAILETQYQISDDYRKLMMEILEERKTQKS